MQDLLGLPVNLLLENKKCLLVGAGNVGYFKAQTLLSAKAKIIVISPEIDLRFYELQKAYPKKIKIIEAKYKKKYIKRKWLVVTATADGKVNRKIFKDCTRKKIWVNSADDPKNCQFTLMSLVRQQNLTLAIGTAGKSPAMSKYLRKKLTDEITPEYGELVEILSDIRNDIKKNGLSTEDVNWDHAFESKIFKLIKKGQSKKAKEIIEKKIKSQQ
jgi:precorrin-2 dehydrogenase/sirohydrochlorin ferrochelatase